MNCAEVVFFPAPGAKSSCMPAHQQVVHTVELGAICWFIFECLHLLNSPAKEWARLDVIWHYQREFTINQARIIFGFSDTTSGEYASLRFSVWVICTLNWTVKGILSRQNEREVSQMGGVIYIRFTIWGEMTEIIDSGVGVK
ncbi:hypothetical protein B0H16DRAFT_1474562 [Mycena metata]|uniref:Uncharacterized protein n=1 Tax=Mycena metata TaxID=1033252 RepID=A0AAD7HG92_9AGAR|nr:hypothetical protein B0H16DRAFT_1474562 [Mycena metata]